jgi:hypothetical protein
MKIENVARLQEKLKALGLSAKQQTTSVIVGYTAAYALFVHENLTAHHPVGQAKFLEQPIRVLASEIRRMVLDNVKNGLTLPQALLLAGLLIQRESMKLVPVDTGNLRASAFTRRDS